MNDSDLKYKNSDNTYRATTNFNTALEDLNASNINSATEINILGPEYSVSESNNTYQDLNVYNNVQNNDISVQSSVGYPNNNNGSNNGDAIRAFVPQHIVQEEPAQVGINSSNINNIDQNNNKQLSYDDVNSSNSFIVGSNKINPQAISNSNANIYMGEDAITSNNSNNKNVKYEPVIEQKKKSAGGQNSNSNKEAIMLLIIVIILLAFVLVMPEIYDFFREARLAFINR